MSLIWCVVPSPLGLWLRLVLRNVMTGCGCCSVVDGVHFDLPVCPFVVFPDFALCGGGGGSWTCLVSELDFDGNLLTFVSFLLTVDFLLISSRTVPERLYGG